MKARFIAPMLATSSASLPAGDLWHYELKLDGYRALGIKTDGTVRLRSRNDKDFSAKFPTIAEALDHLPDETVVDGEVVALDESGRQQFNLLQNFRSADAPLLFSCSTS
jgi:ATP-dependent DNA ligase